MKSAYVIFSRVVSALMLIFAGTIFAPFAGAVVQIDSSSSQGAFDGISGVNSLTWPHTVGNGVSRALYVGVSTSVSSLPGTATARVSGVTYNGAGLTRIGTQVSPLPGSNNAVEIFRLLNPPSGTANIVVSLFASRANYAFAGAVSFTGVDQTNPEGNFFSTAGTNDSPTVTVTDSGSGDLVFDTVSSSFNASSFLVGANQSVCFPSSTPETNCRRGRRFFGGLSDVGAVSTESAVSPVPMSWTLANSDDWAIGAMAVKSLAPTSATAVLEGRVFNARGRAIPRASLVLINSETGRATARTNPFGYFRFPNVPLGQTYVLEISSKRYDFKPLIFNFDDPLINLIIYPVE